MKKLLRTHKPPRRKKGIILVMTLFFMVLFYMLAFGIYTQGGAGSAKHQNQTSGESRTSLRDKTITEASFACGAGIRYTKEWVAAVTKPGAPGSVEQLGEGWNANPTNVIGTKSFFPTHHDVFSVPASDTSFQLRAMAGLTCPKGRFAGKSGIDFLGFRPDANLTTADYTSMKGAEANWPVFVSKQPLLIGEYEVYSYLVPSAKAIASAAGESGDTLKSFLAISVAYRSGLPVLRARVLLKEVSSAKYAYRSNMNGTANGQPVTWVVSNANSVLFDGPVHTNDVWLTSFNPSYWNDPLTYFSWDSVTKKFPKRAFMGGGMTFSGTNTSITPNFDGVGYMGGNLNGSSDSKRPHDGAGLAILSTAQGAQPDPAGGKILTRYDRMIEGGRESIKKIPSVPLPADLVNLKTGAFGPDSVTGLNTSGAPSTWGVDPTQKDGSLQTSTVVRPAYRNSSGTLVPTQTLDNTPTKEVGIFINPVAGTSTAAGGVAIKGDTRNMYLEVTDSNGKLVTSGLHDLSQGDVNSSNSTIGNPTIRVQSTIDSYDSNSGNLITAFTQAGSTGGTWVPPVPATWVPTVPGAYHPTVPGVYVPTVPGVYVPTVPGVYVPTVPGVWVEPTGSGSGSGYWSPPTQNAKWSPNTVNAKWSPNTVNGKWSPATVNAYTSPTVPGYTAATVPGYTSGGGAPIYTSAGVPPVLDPFKYKAQDWVVDVKNVALTIQPTMPLPAGAEATTWKQGYGGKVGVGASNSLQADLPGDTPTGGPNGPKGINEVYLHTPGDTAGTKLNSAMSVPKGKIAVFKQSRSDANRVDVFILDSPNPIGSTKPGLNGAVYGTGNISGLRGVNMEAKSIGVDYSTDKAISIMDNITQYGTVPGEKTPSAYHGLGLVGTKMNVQTRENYFDNTNRFYIYATMIAGKSAVGNTGGLDVSSPNNNNSANFSRTADTTNTNGANRTLHIYGGLTEQQTKARLIGTAGGSKGWNQQFNFDKHLSQLPPPFFPSTNQLAPLSYFQEVVMGQ